jgi:hypothetical protein
MTEEEAQSAVATIRAWKSGQSEGLSTLLAQPLTDAVSATRWTSIVLPASAATALILLWPS